MSNNSNHAITLFISSIFVFKCLKSLLSNNNNNNFNNNNNNKDIYSIDDLPYLAKQILSDENNKIKSDQVQFYSERLSNEMLHRRSNSYYNLMNQRRSIRFFSKDTFPIDILIKCVLTGGTSPSGAHQQPWHFNIISNPNLKSKIREYVEQEEQINYDKRMSESWKNDLAPIFKDSTLHENGIIQKPYLTDAPYLIVVTEQHYGLDENNKRFTHHYVKEGVGIACGLFISALTNIGLFTLTSTPLNAGTFICKLLDRPINEKLYLLMPCGFAANSNDGEVCTVPYRDEIAVEIDLNKSEHNKSLRKHVNNICKIYD
jgi:hypothetical protein